MTANVKKDATWFIDMDGTIAEWKAGCEEQLRMPDYFRVLRPTSFLPSLREFAASGSRGYILSSYLTGCQALRDKLISRRFQRRTDCSCRAGPGKPILSKGGSVWTA